MRFPVVLSCLLGVAVVGTTVPAAASIDIKDRTLTEPLVLDQNEDYLLHKVVVSGITDMAALTLTGRINSVTLAHCAFRNVWAGLNGKAVAAEAQGAIVTSFMATDTAFEDAQHQLICLREGAFGTVTFQRCKFRTSDSFLKKVFAADPWRRTPPTTEFANIDRLELLDNEYLNTILVVHPSVKLVVFRGDVSNVRLKSPNTHVIRLDKDQAPGTVRGDGTELASAVGLEWGLMAEEEQAGVAGAWFRIVEGETAAARGNAAEAESEVVRGEGDGEVVETVAIP